MKSYFCYIHTTTSMTPQLRVVTATADQDVPDAILEAINEWPSFAVIDVYNEHDEAILRLSGAQAASAIH